MFKLTKEYIKLLYKEISELIKGYFGNKTLYKTFYKVFIILNVLGLLIYSLTVLFIYLKDIITIYGSIGSIGFIIALLIALDFVRVERKVGR